MQFSDAAAAEHQSAHIFAACCIEQRLRQTVWGSRCIANLRHTAEAMLYRNTAVVVSLLNERRIDGTGSKAGWAFDDANIFRTGIQVGLLESVRGITFLCRDKRRAYLYAGGADFQHELYIGIVHDAARSKNRNGNVVFLLELSNIGNNICESLFQRLVGFIVQIIQLKAEMTACERALYDNGIRKTVVFPQPLGQNQPARPR